MFKPPRNSDQKRTHIPLRSLAGVFVALIDKAWSVMRTCTIQIFFHRSERVPLLPGCACFEKRGILVLDSACLHRVRLLRVDNRVIGTFYCDIENPHIQVAEHPDQQFRTEYMMMHGAVPEIL